MSYPTLTERKRAKVARMEAAVETLAAELTAYAREHGGRFILFGSAARGELRHDSDVDVLVDFPGGSASDAWLFAEDRAWALGLKPDLSAKGWSGPRLLERVTRDGRVLDGVDAFPESLARSSVAPHPEAPREAGPRRTHKGDACFEGRLIRPPQHEEVVDPCFEPRPGNRRPATREEIGVKDARWIDVRQDCETAARLFRSGARVFHGGGLTGPDGLDRVMTLLHYMQSGHTALESALVRVLEIFDEAPPTGSDWHARLITRCATAIPGSRGAILPSDLAADAQDTRAFRHLAMHVYDLTFEPDKAARAIEAGMRLAEAFPARVEAFAREVDP